MPLRNSRYAFSCSPDGLPGNFAFDPFLFLQAAHLKTQSTDELLIFQIFDAKRKKIAGHFPVFINADSEAYSPGKSPFGGMQFSPEIPPETLAEFLEFMHHYLRDERQCNSIKIKCCPFAYAPEEATHLTNLLLQKGYTVTGCEINQHLPVGPETFEQLAYPATVRRLKKCRNAGLTFQQEPAEFLTEGFAFIAWCRDIKGYRLSLPLEELACLFQRFPDNFMIFSVKSAHELMACTVAVRVNNAILYNFLPASSPAFNNLSPAVMLTQGLYNFCVAEGFSVLDLGTSALPAGPNFPLIAFKKHVGGQPGLKLSFEYKWL